MCSDLLSLQLKDAQAPENQNLARGGVVVLVATSIMCLEPLERIMLGAHKVS